MIIQSLSELPNLPETSVCHKIYTVLPNSRQFRSNWKIVLNLCMLALLSLKTSRKTYKCKAVCKFKKNKTLKIPLYLKQFDFWGLLSFVFGSPQLPCYPQSQVCHMTGHMINGIGHITCFCIFLSYFSPF